MSSLFRFIGLALILTGAAFLVHMGAKNPGTFNFSGFGWDVSMSATFATLLFAIALIFTYFFGQTINWLMNAPARIRNRRGLKKAQGGLDLLHQGFTALAAGDVKTAQQKATQAAKKLPNTTLADLLTAQASQNEDALIALTSNPHTATTGHVGLMEQAVAANQWPQAAHHAQKIISLNKTAPKAEATLREAYLRQQQWQKALPLTQNPDERAALTLLEALDERTQNPQYALKITTAARKKHPQFIPLVMFEAALLTSLTQHKAAEKLLTASFQQIPRLDTFSRLQDTLEVTTPDAKKRHKRLQTIINKLPATAALIQHLTSADVALAQNNLTAARKALTLARNHDAESRELCQRFAKLEKQENNQEGHTDWLQKALIAPSLPQESDATVHFWHTFKNTYTPTALTPTLPQNGTPNPTQTLLVS